MNRYTVVLWILAALAIVFLIATHDPTVSGGIPG